MNNSGLQDVRAAGIIDHLTRLPDDNVGERLKRALVTSVAVNVVVFGLAYFASQLHRESFVPPIQVEFLEKSYDDLPRLLKLARPKPRVSAAPVVRRKMLVVPKVKPIPVRQPRIVNRTKVLPLSKPVVTPKKITVANTERSNPSAANPNAVAPTPAVATPRTTNVTTNSSVTVNVNTNRAITTGATPDGPGVAAPNLRKLLPTTSTTTAAQSSASSVEAATERNYSATIAALPNGATSVSPATTRAGSGVSSGNVGVAASRRSTGLGVTGNTVRVDSISTPAFIGRRTPALGSTVIINDRPTILTASMEESGRANSGFATIQGAAGTVARSVSLGATVVSKSGTGTTSSGVGSRNLATSDTVSTSVTGVASAGANRTARLGNTDVVATVGTTRPGAAADGPGGNAAISGNDSIGALANASTRGSGGGSGPVGVGSGSARVGGSSGGGNIKVASNTSDAKVTANPDKVGTDDQRRPITVNVNTIAKSGAAGGTAATRNEDARASFRPDIELPTELKSRQFKSRVLVEVEVSISGQSQTTLVSGSGDVEVDRLVLQTLRRWKWMPGFRDGKEVATKQKFEYVIKVN